MQRSRNTIGGHATVTDVGLDYEDNDLVSDYMQNIYLDVLEWNYQDIKVQRNSTMGSSGNATFQQETVHQIEETNNTPGHMNEDDYSLYLGGCWNAAKRLMKMRKFNFDQAIHAAEEAVKSQPKNSST